VLTNDYYKLLLSEKWTWKTNDESSEGKVVKWVGPAQLEDATTKSLMMLPTDYALVKV
jgi:cytochrome c peroxidase